MAVTIQCPRCDNTQKVDESKLGKKVPCKKCENLIQTGRKKTMLASSSEDEPAASKKGSNGKPTAITAKKGNPTRVDTRAKRRRDEDDDDDDRRPMPRKGGKKQGGSGMLFIVLGGGALLLFLILCGGGAIVGGYFAFAEEKQPAPIAQIDPPPIIFPGPGPNPPIIINPPIIVNPPFPGPGPNPFPPNPFPGKDPFGREVLDANDPTRIDRVITLIKGPENERSPAYAWLDSANLAHPRRAEVATLLDGMVKNHVDAAPISRDEALFRAFFRWADKENVPTLIHIVGKAHPLGITSGEQEKAIRMLGTFKDPRGVEPILPHMNRNVRPREIAVAALIDMGPIAETKVLAYFNHPEEYGERHGARRLIVAYKTSSDKILTQCIADLDSTEQERRRPASQWIAEAQVIPQRKSEVAKAVNNAISKNNFQMDQNLSKVLEKWGTADNVPLLIQMLDQNKNARECISLLAKTKDPQGMRAVTKSMTNFFNQGDAKKALRDFGPGAENYVVEQMGLTNDGGHRRMYVNFLGGEVGTRACLPALQQLALRNQQDRALQTDVGNAMKNIQFRGK